MKRVARVLVAVAFIVGMASVVAAAPPRFELREDAAVWSPFQAGDRLVPIGDGQVEWYRDGRLLATVTDPDGLITDEFEPAGRLYLRDADGSIVRELRPDAALFLSKDAPEIVFYRKDFQRPTDGFGLHVGAQATSSVLMTFHGGTVLTASKTMAIFWGSSWNNATFAGDRITGIDSFFAGFGNSNYAGTTTEYSGTNGQVTKTSAYLGHVIDTTSPPSRALTTSKAVSEACKIVGNNPDPAALYLIYTSTGAGNVNYCAWHSWGSCSNGKPIQVAYMPNISGNAGCDPGDTWTTHSQGLAAVANVTAHELAETITDPRGLGWFDSSGAENGDKCAWSFLGPVTLSNGSVWKLQGEWSNAAYNAGTGYPNRSGQNGCLQGQ